MKTSDKATPSQRTARVVMDRLRAVIPRGQMVVGLVLDSDQFAMFSNRSVPPKVLASLLRAWANELDGEAEVSAAPARSGFVRAIASLFGGRS